MLDLNTEYDHRANKRLLEDEVIWFTKVSPVGTPIPTPVWFFWDGEETLCKVNSGLSVFEISNTAQEYRFIWKGRLLWETISSLLTGKPHFILTVKSKILVIW